MNTLLSRKNIITIVALLALLVILPIILYLTRRRQEIRPRALTGNVNLHLTPLSPPNVSAGDVFDEVISIDVTNSAVKVTGADLVVLYDKTKLEVENIFPFINEGDYFTDAPIIIPAQDYEGEGNSFKSLRVSVVNRANPLEGGTQLVATVQFKALANGSATIKFPDDNSLLQVVGYNSLTPAATPPTATPTPIGLPSATPTITITPTPTGLPSATPTITSTPTPTGCPTGGYSSGGYCWYLGDIGQNCDQVCVSHTSGCVSENWDDDDQCSIGRQFSDCSGGCYAFSNFYAPGMGILSNECYYRGEGIGGVGQSCSAPAPTGFDYRRICACI